MSPFEARVTKSPAESRVHTVTLSGRLDASGLSILQSAIEPLRSPGGSRVVFDLAGVSFVGSAGIGLFLSFVEEVRGAGGDVRFVHVAEGIHAIFALLNILDFFTQSPDEAQAIRELCA